LKFSAHINKGAWAFASRALPLVYAVALILVARSFPPSEFGVLAVFQTLFTILFTFSDGFALQAIVKFGVEPDTKLEELVTVTTVLFFAFLGSALILVSLFPAVVGSLLHIPELEGLIPYLVALAILTTPRVVFSKVLQSRFRMKEIFFVDFANFGLASILIYILLPMGRIHDAQDVIRITVLTGAASSIVAIILVRPYIAFRFRYSRAMLGRISEFVRYQAAMGLTSTLQQNLDTLLVSSFMGAAGAGIYSGAKMLFRGFDIVRETMTLFVFPASSKYYSRGDIPTLRTILEKSVSFLYLLLVPVAVVLLLGSPLIFHTIYGAKYDGSIPIFRILVLAAIFFPIQMVFNVTMTGMGKIREAFRMFAVTLIVNAVLAITLLSITRALEGAAIAFLVATFVQTIQLFVFIRRHVGFDTNQLWRRGFSDTMSFARGLARKENSSTL
jgi:O-antigen/teichoic acid export membrane protein